MTRVAIRIKHLLHIAGAGIHSIIIGNGRRQKVVGNEILSGDHILRYGPVSTR